MGDAARITVHATKTEHVSRDGGTRPVPIFPELYPYRRECFEQAEDDQVEVFAGHRAGAKNLRTPLTRFSCSSALSQFD